MKNKELQDYINESLFNHTRGKSFDLRNLENSMDLREIKNNTNPKESIDELLNTLTNLHKVKIEQDHMNKEPKKSHTSKESTEKKCDCKTTNPEIFKELGNISELIDLVKMLTSSDDYQTIKQNMLDLIELIIPEFFHYMDHIADVLNCNCDHFIQSQANIVYLKYDAYKNAGFSDSQAFDLVKKTLGSPVNIQIK